MNNFCVILWCYVVFLIVGTYQIGLRFSRRKEACCFFALNGVYPEHIAFYSEEELNYHRIWKLPDSAIEHTCFPVLRQKLAKIYRPMDLTKETYYKIREFFYKQAQNYKRWSGCRRSNIFGEYLSDEQPDHTKEYSSKTSGIVGRFGKTGDMPGLQESYPVVEYVAEHSPQERAEATSTTASDEYHTDEDLFTVPYETYATEDSSAYVELSPNTEYSNIFYKLPSDKQQVDTNVGQRGEKGNENEGILSFIDRFSENDYSPSDPQNTKVNPIEASKNMKESHAMEDEQDKELSAEEVIKDNYYKPKGDYEERATTKSESYNHADTIIPTTTSSPSSGTNYDESRELKRKETFDEVKSKEKFYEEAVTITTESYDSQSEDKEKSDEEIQIHQYSDQLGKNSELNNRFNEEYAMEDEQDMDLRIEAMKKEFYYPSSGDKGNYHERATTKSEGYTTIEDFILTTNSPSTTASVGEDAIEDSRNFEEDNNQDSIFLANHDDLKITTTSSSLTNYDDSRELKTKEAFDEVDESIEILDDSEEKLYEETVKTTTEIYDSQSEDNVKSGEEIQIHQYVDHSRNNPGLHNRFIGEYAKEKDIQKYPEYVGIFKQPESIKENTPSEAENINSDNDTSYGKTSEHPKEITTQDSSTAEITSEHTTEEVTTEDTINLRSYYWPILIDHEHQPVNQKETDKNLDSKEDDDTETKTTISIEGSEEKSEEVNVSEKSTLYKVDYFPTRFRNTDEDHLTTHDINIKTTEDDDDQTKRLISQGNQNEGVSSSDTHSSNEENKSWYTSETKPDESETPTTTEQQILYPKEWHEQKNVESRMKIEWIPEDHKLSEIKPDLPTVSNDNKLSEYNENPTTTEASSRGEEESEEEFYTESLITTTETYDSESEDETKSDEKYQQIHEKLSSSSKEQPNLNSRFLSDYAKEKGYHEYSEFDDVTLEQTEEEKEKDYSGKMKDHMGYMDFNKHTDATTSETTAHSFTESYEPEKILKELMTSNEAIDTRINMDKYKIHVASSEVHQMTTTESKFIDVANKDWGNEYEITAEDLTSESPVAGLSSEEASIEYSQESDKNIFQEIHKQNATKGNESFQNHFRPSEELKQSKYSE